MAISSKGERIRDDARVPVLVLQSETDVVLLGGGWRSSPTPTDCGSGRWRARRMPTRTRSAWDGTTTAR